VFEKGIVSPTIRSGRGILEGRPSQTPHFQTVSRFEMGQGCFRDEEYSLS
jgi:hypothetical protein